MHAIVCHGQKDLRLEECEPVPLADEEVRVRVRYGGICGSDIHYYHHGGVGDFSIREPMILGHEVAGEIIDGGSARPDLAVGQPVAIDPARPCRACSRCHEGRPHLCMNMRFLGSASRVPHVQGGFVEQLVLRGDQVIPVPRDADLLRVACAEPLSVALHAVNRLGNILGARVLVAGSGPIGALTMAALKFAGAGEVVATDLADHALAVAASGIGVDRTINISEQPERLAEYAERGGYFDFAVEASGAPAALQSLIPIVHAGGRILQLGMLPPGDTAAAINKLQAREIDLIGSFRANDEFADAVALIVANKLDVSPILSGVYTAKAAQQAFEMAPDRTQVMKLHLAIS